MERIEMTVDWQGWARLVVIAAGLVLSGCASHEKLAVASGPIFPLNPDHWQATPADLTAPDANK